MSGNVVIDVCIALMLKWVLVQLYAHSFSRLVARSLTYIPRQQQQKPDQEHRERG